MAFESKDVYEVGEWLTQKGFSLEVVDAFEGIAQGFLCALCTAGFSPRIEQGMDGEAVSSMLGCVSGPDCLKEVVTRFGDRVKVYRALRTEFDRAG